MAKYSLRLLALTAALLAGGRATALTVDAISPGEGEEGFDYVASVTAAWRDADGNVTVCVTGMPAGANYWLGSSRSYRLVYPAASSPDLKVFYHEAIPEYQVTAADVKGECPSEMPGMTPLPVGQIHAREFGKGDYSEMSDEALAAFFADRAEAPAVYMFEYRFGKEYGADLMKVVYVHETPVQGTARAVEFATRGRKRNGSPAHALLLPFAVAWDVVTFPVQLLAVLAHGV